MQKPELELHKPFGPWRQLNALASSGIWEQILAQDPSAGHSTALQRFDPGAETGSGVITHPYWEEILILSGAITDTTLQETFTSGMYACRPPGMPHGPYRSDAGCQMIVFVTQRAT